VQGISCVTNLAAGLGATPLSHEEVCETGRQVEQRLTGLLQRLAPRIAALVETAEVGKNQPCATSATAVC
jgi:purine-nucleoside phosphorylase